MKSPYRLLLVFFIILSGCSTQNETRHLTLFFANDIHGQIDNLAKVKHIVDLEKQHGPTVLVCSGDIFSGNPVIDQYKEKGYPIIDLMNQTGFAISTIGNHEFDYGITTLKNRLNQSKFEWLCANADLKNAGIDSLSAYKTITIAGVNITFLGLLETNGKLNDSIPSTHPWKIKGALFERPETVVPKYANLKSQENSDLYIALTHLGFCYKEDVLSDCELAKKHPYFDMIIGGHSHEIIDTTINHIPTFQAGSYLNYLGKITLTIKDKKIDSLHYERIDLNKYTGIDQELQAQIEHYNNLPYLQEVVGAAKGHQTKSDVGCFYADALKTQMNVDIAFQNTGGVRSDLDDGEITKREIFEIAPFNNGTVIYEMTVSQIKTFLKESKSGFYYAGPKIEQKGKNITFTNVKGEQIPDTTTLKVGLNDYIPAVHEDFFPNHGYVQNKTASETLISYLKSIQKPINYQGCKHYFKYQLN